MDAVSVPTLPRSFEHTHTAPSEAHTSGVSWAAVIAGAFVIASASLALLALGGGIGFSAMSPWRNDGASASSVGWSAIVWLVLMQVITCALGGYLAGRLRTRWVNVHTHEVYFRDTAHGFLAWAVGLVITTAFLSSAAATMVGGVVTGASAGAAATAQTSDSGANAYLIDTMFRGSTPSATPAATGDSSGEMTRIFANSVSQGSLPAADRAYVASTIATRTGISQAEAEKRVDETDAQIRQAADAGRKAIAHSLYWTFLALLVGAFTASYAATFGGRQRDRDLATR